MTGTLTNRGLGVSWEGKHHGQSLPSQVVTEDKTMRERLDMSKPALRLFDSYTCASSAQMLSETNA